MQREIESVPQKSIVASKQILQDVRAVWLASCIRAVCFYRVPQILGDEVMSVGDIAFHTKTQVPLIANVLRYLSTFGYFECMDQTERDDYRQRFRNTSLSLCLIEQSPYILNHLGKRMMQEWQCLEALLVSGINAPRQLFQMPLYQYFDAHPEESKLFDDALEATNIPVVQAIASAFPFAGTVVDIGGGTGALLNAILTHYPDDCHCVLYERETVLRAVRYSKLELAISSGDFFDEGTFPHGDILILAHVLHNYQNYQCLALLEKCRQALQPGGQLILIEMLRSPSGVFDQGTEALSLLMHLEQEGGYERKEDEYDDLLQSAGFVLHMVKPLPKGNGMLFARLK